MQKYYQNRKKEAGPRGIKRETDDNELPLCLYSTYQANGERHYPSNCAISDNKTTASLMAGYHKAK